MLRPIRYFTLILLISGTAIAQSPLPTTLIAYRGDGVSSPNSFSVTTVAEQRSPYARLQQVREHYARIAADGGWERVNLKKTIRSGESDPGVALLRERLQITGDYSGGPASDPYVYDQSLETAVVRFQKRHGLAVDGVVGPNTLSAINVPVEERIAQLDLNIERLASFPADDGTRRIIVNIPEFTLRAFDNGSEELQMNVVVGKTSSRLRTPVFSDEIEYIVFKPYWNVPRSITVHEYLPKIEGDSTYLARSGFQVVTSSGARLDPGHVTAEMISEGDIRLRQAPGRGNALGDVKFIFPNRYGVYLHDSPHKSLFNRSSRAYSHGCVRVAEPENLAVWVLKEQEEEEDWDLERVKDSMKRNRKHVPLSQKIPVHIVYWTAYVEADGTVNFLEDIYGHDKRSAITF